MTAVKKNSSVMAAVKEDTEGVLKDPASSDFMTLREAFSMSPTVETVESDELINDIGASEAFVSGEGSTQSFPKYVKPPVNPGEQPDYGIMLESAMGAVTENVVEYEITGGTLGRVNLAGGEELNFKKGQAVSVPLADGGRVVRCVKAIGAGGLELNFRLPSAPATSGSLKLACHYEPTADGHPSYSAHVYQSSAATSALHQASAGNRTTSTVFTFNAKELPTVDFDSEGSTAYWNPISIDASNKFIDFTDDLGTSFIELEEKYYQTPQDLGDEAAFKLSEISTGQDFTCTYSDSDGTFTFEATGTTFELLWDTGANNANGAYAAFGFDKTDLTGALEYTSTNAVVKAPPVTPDPDDTNMAIVKYDELFIGDKSSNVTFHGTNVTCSITTPKSTLADFASPTGNGDSITPERTVELTAQLQLEPNQSRLFYEMIKNGTLEWQFAHGPRSGTSFTPGQTCVLWSESSKVTSHEVSDVDGILVIDLTMAGFVSPSTKDLHINFV